MRMLFQRRMTLSRPYTPSKNSIRPVDSNLRWLPHRFCSSKKQVEIAPQDKYIVAAMTIGGVCGAISLGEREYRNTYNSNRDFGERVIKVTGSTIIGFCLGTGFVMLSPIVVPTALLIGIICYSYPPPPPETIYTYRERRS
jgi:hypothetical protein